MDGVDDSCIDLDKLYIGRLNKEKRRVMTYLNVYKKLVTKIIQANTREETELLFPIPTFIMGVPLFDPQRCAAYMMVRLNKKGFIVKYVQPNVLYVCWNIEKEDLPEPTKEVISQEESKMLSAIESYRDQTDFDLIELMDKQKVFGARPGAQ